MKDRTITLRTHKTVTFITILQSIILAATCKNLPQPKLVKGMANSALLEILLKKGKSTFLNLRLHCDTCFMQKCDIHLSDVRIQLPCYFSLMISNTLHMRGRTLFDNN